MQIKIKKSENMVSVYLVSKKYVFLGRARTLNKAMRQAFRLLDGVQPLHA